MPLKPKTRDHTGPLADEARRIASYCEGLAKQEEIDTLRRAVTSSALTVTTGVATSETPLT